MVNATTSGSINGIMGFQIVATLPSNYLHPLHWLQTEQHCIPSNTPEISKLQPSSCSYLFTTIHRNIMDDRTQIQICLRGDVVLLFKRAAVNSRDRYTTISTDVLPSQYQFTSQDLQCCRSDFTHGHTTILYQKKWRHSSPHSAFANLKCGLSHLILSCPFPKIIWNAALAIHKSENRLILSC